MPGVVAPASATMAYESEKFNAHNASKISERKRHGLRIKPSDIQKKPKRRLRKPLSNKARLMITKNTTKLIERRDTLDREVLVAVKKETPNSSDWLSRDKLLRNRGHLEKQERSHLSKCTKTLAGLERLYRRDPSFARAHDYDLVRTLLWRFKRNLGPLLESYTNQSSKRNNDSNQTSSSGSDSESAWSDTTDEDDEELPRKLITPEPSSNHRYKTPKKAKTNLQSQDTATAEYFTRETPIQTKANKEKRKHEQEPAQSLPSKKVRFALDDDINDLKYSHDNRNKERKGMTLNQDTENGKQSSRGILKNDEPPTISCTPQERRLIEGRRRLDEIVSQCFKALDSLVCDTLDWPFDFDFNGRRHMDSRNPGKEMSGALMIDSSIDENSFGAKPGYGVGKDPINPCPSIVEPGFSSHEPGEPKILTTLPAIHHKLQGANQSPNDDQKINPDLRQIESGNQQLRAAQDRNRSASSHFDRNSPNPLAPSGSSSWNASGETNGEYNQYVENSARPSPHQLQLSHSRRVTPVPAPQPWRVLGILSPFGDGLPPTPTKSSQHHHSSGTRIIHTKEPTSNRSKLREPRLPEPESSPLNGFLHTNSDK
ncbi:hypothetical protein GQX73_g4820 [Xylaria multiplex]|uniref:Uncharacterized protein n=1 Tax=Xylaria multiplex TaxID=323545 RepID=A0A7C8J1N4_9PEZI|nr:hypothetical protein GQX73_g4820 [Xylaria multiplex]